MFHFQILISQILDCQKGSIKVPLTHRNPIFRVPTAQGKQRKWPKKNPCVWKFCQNTGKSRNFVCSSCKFPDAKGKGYCNICRENFNFPPRSWISQFCVCNSHKLWKLAQRKFAVGQEKHRENTGNLKIQFEWVPCILFSVY